MDYIPGGRLESQPPLYALLGRKEQHHPIEPSLFLQMWPNVIVSPKSEWGVPAWKM